MRTPRNDQLIPTDRAGKRGGIAQAGTTFQDALGGLAHRPVSLAARDHQKRRSRQRRGGGEQIAHEARTRQRAGDRAQPGTPVGRGEAAGIHRDRQLGG